MHLQIQMKLNPILQFQKSITSMIVCQVMAIDLRGHGETSTEDEENLSADTLASSVQSQLKNNNLIFNSSYSQQLQ